MQVKRDLGTWVQIVTGVAVVIGLALVIVELRQVQTLSRAQLSSDAMKMTRVSPAASKSICSS
jgi:hypothetical protein